MTAGVVVPAPVTIMVPVMEVDVTGIIIVVEVVAVAAGGEVIAVDTGTSTVFLLSLLL